MVAVGVCILPALRRPGDGASVQHRRVGTVAHRPDRASVGPCGPTRATPDDIARSGRCRGTDYALPLSCVGVAWVLHVVPPARPA